jgi:metallophosphoesterase superfamily enzyme
MIRPQCFQALVVWGRRENVCEGELIFRHEFSSWIARPRFAYRPLEPCFAYGQFSSAAWTGRDRETYYVQPAFGVYWR